MMVVYSEGLGVIMNLITAAIVLLIIYVGTAPSSTKKLPPPRGVGWGGEVALSPGPSLYTCTRKKSLVHTCPFVPGIGVYCIFS